MYQKCQIVESSITFYSPLPVHHAQATTCHDQSPSLFLPANNVTQVMVVIDEQEKPDKRPQVLRESTK